MKYNPVKSYPGTSVTLYPCDINMYVLKAKPSNSSQQKLQKQNHRWSCLCASSPPHPSSSTLVFQDFAKDCGICYAYRLEGSVPDQVCDDPRCGQPFHQACLYEVKWPMAQTDHELAQSGQQALST